ncbi:RNA polymerase II C-terminal domain phosphatase-like 4 [Chenopodium quinoa]|uniref:RNA polymerase II C-terminal domain phosphatase-like 4 n=1 Tax=Chenopodium quinoa TaxID=63459 RepID=UPI000B76E9DC|nr:RNA polymerase II C-terminal domain phosphatase-like 4 [Chenopodium quinoa]
MDSSETKSEHGDNKINDPTTLTFRYIQPELTLTLEEIERLQDDNLNSLYTRKKLHLLLDLDHTLVHARETVTFKSEEIKSFKNMNDVFEIFNGSFIVKLRPGVREFLREASSMFDLSIYTRGERSYGQTMRDILDSKEGGESMFSYVIAKEDCLKAERKGLDNVKKEGKRMDKELIRVLRVLREVHNLFYFDDKFKYVDQRDVRDVLKRVMRRPLTILNRVTRKIGRFLVCLESNYYSYFIKFYLCLRKLIRK